MKCAECPTIADCKNAFGKYWAEKSANGTGCKTPFAYDRTARRTPPPPPSNRKPIQRIFKYGSK